MKKVLLFFILIALFLTALPCFADVDPILIKRPNPGVYECTEELVIEMLVEPIIVYSTGNVIADNYFFVLTIEFLYLQDYPWNGLDKSSFLLRHQTIDGREEIIPLNYMMTSNLAIKNGWKTMADKYVLGTLVKMNLVFDVKTNDKSGWTLIFRPAERGDDPSCEVNIPLHVRNY